MALQKTNGDVPVSHKSCNEKREACIRSHRWLLALLVPALVTIALASVAVAWNHETRITRNTTMVETTLITIQKDQAEILRLIREAK